MSQPIKKSDQKMTHPHELRELTEILIKYHKLNQGFFELGIEFQFGIGPVGIEPSKTIPGGLFGVTNIGLVTTKNMGPNTVDAAEINPRVSPSKRVSKKTIK